MGNNKIISFILLVGIAAGAAFGEGFRMDFMDLNVGGSTRLFSSRAPEYFEASMVCQLDTGAVDIVFCMDTSRSMEPYIADLEVNIIEFIDSIVARGYDFRLGAVPFDDSTNIWDFNPSAPGNQMTADTAEFISWLDTGVSEIASDSWEVSLDAICDALRDYQWREDALRIIIMFTNEGYHSTDDDTNLSDESFAGTMELVLETGAVVFIAASSRPAWVGSPIPPYQMANFILLADTSGGRLDSLTEDWTFILNDVVDLISTFTSVSAMVINETGSACEMHAEFIPLDSTCMSLHSDNPLHSEETIPDGDAHRFFWKVILDSTCIGTNRCFEIAVWGGGDTDTFYGCITDDSCFGHTDLVLDHTTPTLSPTCLDVHPNPVNLTFTITNNGIRPASDVVMTITPYSGLTIVGGDSNPAEIDAIAYDGGSAIVNWELEIAPEAFDTTLPYRVLLEHAEGSDLFYPYLWDIPGLQPQPEVTILCEDSILCPGECADLNSAVDPTGVWYYSWTPVDGLSDPGAPNPTACPLTTTVYKLDITDGVDCTDGDSITVIVADSIFVDAGSTIEIFPGRYTTIGGSPTATGGYGDLTYEWTPAEGLDDPSIPNPTANPFFPTTYTVIVTDDAGCFQCDSTQVQIKPPLGYIYVQDEFEILELRVIDTLDAIESGNGVIMVTMPGDIIGGADLVDSTDTWASPVMIQTTHGIRSWRHKIYTP